MSSFHLRPRFEVTADMDPESWREWFVGQLKEAGEHFEIKSFTGFIALRIPVKERHFWSPRLNLTLEESEPGTTQIEGHYGPNANVWSLFLFSYLFFGMIAVITGIFTISQWMIGNQPWGVWMLAAALLVLVILYFVAQFGQKLGAQQTFQLHQVFEDAYGESVRLR